eukprot:TRINITY_DN1249_c0_g1_i1.p1 TRINITY_DN1249_c0_g1~~TRINITY_DN1249_c0_g1_i1.p1  ORF type:complete len:143 (+),score=44.86 TRINITY_DN1249_c0_g1_i1:48-476(+)
MFKKLVVCVALLLSLAVATKVTFSNCGHSTDPFVADTLDVTPFPITHGANTSILIDGNANLAIAGGNFVIKVFVAGFQVFTVNQDFCQVVTCPIQKGHQIVNYHYPIPSYAPSGVTVTVQVEGQDLTKNSLFCYKFDSKVLM